LNRNAAAEYIVMLVEDVKQPPHTLLQSDAWDPSAVVNMPAMHTKDQAVSVDAMLLQYDTSTSRCSFSTVSIPSCCLSFRFFLVVYHFLRFDCHVYNIRSVCIKSTFY
jgi:hypothetical protein